MSEEKVVVVFSGQDIENFQKWDGCGEWALNPNRVKGVKYLLVIRNRTKIGESWATTETEYAHNEAYMLAKISGETEYAGWSNRYTIKISEYVMIPSGSGFDNARKRLHYPKQAVVLYDNVEHIKNALGLDIHSFTDWKPFISLKSDLQIKQEPEEEKEEKNYEDNLPSIIEDAKEMVASALDIDKSKITIKIEF